MQRPKKTYLSIFTMSMMSVAAVMSLRGLPLMAIEGLTMFFYLLFAILFFLLPVSMISAELASAFPEGGIYRWASEAFGNRIGFLAIWLQWIQNIIWYPLVLSSAAASLSFLILDSYLAENKWFNFMVIQVMYWLATFVNLRGIKLTGKLTTLGVILGTIIPGICIIVAASIWTLKGEPLAFLEGSQSGTLVFIPDLHDFSTLSFLAGTVLLFGGIEVNAVHVIELKKPRKDYIHALFIAVILIISLFTLGSFSVATLIPLQDIHLNSGIMSGLKFFLDSMQLSWLIPVIASCVLLGYMATILTWIAGPSRGLLETAPDGLLPPFFTATNKRGVQKNILYIQGGIVSCIAVLYLVMPNISSAYFLLSILTVTPYLVMYLIMYLSFIRLRYTQADIPRIFKIKGGKWGSWGIFIMGSTAIIFALIVGFIPPKQLDIGYKTLYVSVLLTGLFLCVLIPILLSYLQRAKWKRSVPDEE